MTLPYQSPLSCIISEYFRNLSHAILNVSITQLELAVHEITKCLKNGGTILIAGNGGSASTSVHMAGDWLSSTTHFRPRPRVLALAENVARLTAIANDLSYDEIFSEQLGDSGPGDILLILSVSGDSPNVVLAAEKARRRGMTVISALGRNGLCAASSDFVVLLGDADYGLAEDLHSALTHMVVRVLDSGKARRFSEKQQIAVPPGA